MKKSTPKLSLMPFLFGGALVAAAVTTPPQTTPFDLVESFSGSGMGTVADNGDLSALFQPFDSALGTLQSFLISWNLSGEYTGTAAATEGGSAQMNLGGVFAINGSTFNGTGGGANVAVGPGEMFDEDYAAAPFSYDFQVAAAGMQYDPAILATVTGTEPFTATYTSGAPQGPVFVNYSGLEALNVTFTGSVTLTYTYEPADMPGELRAIHFTYDFANGRATVRWQSDPTKTYAVDISDDLIDWKEITDSATATGNETEFTEENIPAEATVRFYRVREL